MASHFVGLNRGVEGSLYSDYQTGAVSTGAVFEVRLDDASGFTRRDMQIALDAIERFINNPQLWAPAGFILNG
jgi:hypothetical protein